MLRRTLPFTLALLLNACSGRYTVGVEDDATNQGGEPSLPEEMGSAGARSLGAGGGGTMMQPSFGGAVGTMNPPTMTGGIDGMNPPDSLPPGMNAQGGIVGMVPANDPAVTCDASGLPEEPAVMFAPADVLWTRLALFLASHDLGQDEPQPVLVTREWVESKAAALFVEHPDGAMFEIMLARAGLNPNTAAAYGTRLRAPMATARDLFAPADRERLGGVLTDPDFLSQYPSISKRGWFVAGAFLCLQIPPEPPSMDPSPIPRGPGQTGRQALQGLVSGAACRGCHDAIDPLGYSLENFDEQGAYRTQDNGQDIDAGGAYSYGTLNFMFRDYTDLVPQLQGSCEFARCFTRRLLTQAVSMSRSLRVEEATMLVKEEDVTRLAAEYYSGDGSMLRLVQRVASSRTFGQ